MSASTPGFVQDQLGALCRSIAAYVAQVRAPSDELYTPLAHLGRSAERAQPKQPAPAAATHAYAELVTRAAGLGVAGPAGDIARVLQSAHVALPWIYHYDVRSEDARLAERIAFAELIGPNAPMRAPDCRVGFTVITEQTIYPLHVHPAIEVYLVVSGRARWRTTTSDRILLPGEWLLHASNEPHAMQTFDEPLLALWGWSGDVDAPAIYI